MGDVRLITQERIAVGSSKFKLGGGIDHVTRHVFDNIKTWTELPEEESIRMIEDRDKWRNYVYSVADPWIEDG